jgi:hypothetical protein
MKPSSILAGVAGALLATTAAAAPLQVYDLEGNPVQVPPPTGQLPGDLWRAVTHSQGGTRGIAPYQGDMLVGYNGAIFRLRESDGSLVETFPIADPNDAWLGYDASRDLIITTNPITDTIRAYVPGNAAPVFTVPTPTPGPVGAAWDSTRDEYVYCDWEADQVVVLDPTTLATVRTFPTGLTRMAGVAYDCQDDVYIVGDRDARRHYLIDPDSGAILLSYPTAATATSSPQGAGLSSDGGVWEGEFTTATIYLQEAGHGPSTACASGGNSGSAYCSGDGTGAICPCAALGGSGEGCLTTSGSGALLVGSGNAGVANDSLTLTVSGGPANKPGIFFQGNNQLNGGNGNPAGDGLLCTAGGTIRYSVNPLDATGATSQTGFGANAGTGLTRNYQYWFRDTGNACGGGFNFTNGWTVTWN